MMKYFIISLTNKNALIALTGNTEILDYPVILNVWLELNKAESLRVNSTCYKSTFTKVLTLPSIVSPPPPPCLDIEIVGSTEATISPKPKTYIGCSDVSARRTLVSRDPKDGKNDTCICKNFAPLNCSSSGRFGV